MRGSNLISTKCHWQEKKALTFFDTYLFWKNAKRLVPYLSNVGEKKAFVKS